MSKLIPTKVTLEVEANTFTTTIYAGNKIISQQVMNWEVKNGCGYFIGKDTQDFAKRYPEFSEEMLSGIDAANVAIHLQDFADGCHPDIY